MGKETSPFIQLAGAQYIDVLCVNCYECVKFDNVDSHSLICGKKGYHDVKYGIDIERDMKRLVKSQVKNDRKFSQDFEADDVDEDLN